MECETSATVEETNIVIPYKRRYLLNDAFFSDGDVQCSGSNSKQLVVDIDQEEFLYNTVEEFSCSIAGCMIRFSTIHDYEWHYNNVHRNVCKDCKRLFPTNHLLELHFLENHDTFFQLLSEKQNMYKCLVESCDGVFKDCTERKNHLICVHKFPPNFRFAQYFNTKIGSKSIKNQTTSAVQKESAASNDMEVVVPSTSESNACAKIKYAPKIPKNICFGYGSTKGFPSMKEEKGKTKKKRNWNQKLKCADQMDTSTNIEEMKFQDLIQSLPGENSATNVADDTSSPPPLLE